jgi:prepilin-type N-terminal cleavage/methylation domain-containing protein
MHQDHHRQAGFALLEILVAIAIMAIVGLLAWRGMDAMIRGREVIERRAESDLAYLQLVRQFDQDCQAILRRDELLAATNVLNNGSGGTSNNLATSAASNQLSAIAAGAKNIWWLRHYYVDNQDAWLLVGYGVVDSGLQRWTSHPLLSRKAALSVWNAVSQDPDLLSSDLLVTWQAPEIIKQSFVVQTLAVAGAGNVGTSASGAGTPPVNGASASSQTSSTTSTTIVAPDPQGLVMQWWPKETTLPISRSCLLGGAL